MSSDVMSRGLDVNNVGVVVNYDVPTYINTYVHRYQFTCSSLSYFSELVVRPGRVVKESVLLWLDQMR